MNHLRKANVAYYFFLKCYEIDNNNHRVFRLILLFYKVEIINKSLVDKGLKAKF